MSYSFSITNDFPNSLVNASNLTDEIRSSPITIALDYINTNGDTITIIFKDTLPNQSLLTTVIANHDHISKQPPPQIIKVEEECIPTNGIYKTEARIITGATGITNHDFMWNKGINVMTIQIRTLDENYGDQIKLYVMGPNNGIVGVASGITGSTGVSVLPIVAQNVYPGEQIIVGNQDMGDIISVDKINNVLYMKNCATNAYTNQYVFHRRNIFDPFLLGPAEKYILGECKIGGAYVPQGYTVRVQYINNGVVEKKLYTIIEYLY